MCNHLFGLVQFGMGASITEFRPIAHAISETKPKERGEGGEQDQRKTNCTNSFIAQERVEKVAVAVVHAVRRAPDAPVV